MRALAAVLALSLALLLPGSALAAPGTPNRVYFPQTGHYLAYGFLDYWLEHGGIPAFGYPITEELQQNGMTVQYFERAVFEYHPNNPPDWQVELRRLGADATAGRQGEAPFQPVSAANDPNCNYYAPTGHRLCFGFKDYWLQHGGLAIFGYPISEEFQEGGYTVQYFERARFEYHPNNPPEWRVELGLLGDWAAQQGGVSTAPLAASSSIPAYALDLWPGCTVSQLQAGHGQGEGAAGTILETLTLQNTSGDTCTLYGYPGMLLLDAAGNPLPTTVHWGSGGAYPFLDVPPQRVFLIPGGTASFNLLYHQIPTAPATSCPASTQVEITPPNDFDQLDIPAAFHACGGDLWVSPVVLGSQGVPR